MPHKEKSSSHLWCNRCFASLRHLSLPSLSRLQQLIPRPHLLFTNSSYNFLSKNYILLFPKSTIIPPLSCPLIRTRIPCGPSSSFLHGARSQAPNCTCKHPQTLHMMMLQPHVTPQGPRSTEAPMISCKQPVTHCSQPCHPGELRCHRRSPPTASEALGELRVLFWLREEACLGLAHRKMQIYRNTERKITL